ncbi:WD40 domain-containing protein [Larkinella punicea]|nr:caspase family protein [Larkinella punicea]
MKTLLLFILFFYLLLASLITYSQKPELVVPVGHTEDIHSLAYSPNGRYVLSGSVDRTLKLWEFGTGKLLRTFEGHLYSVNSAVFSRNGMYILSGSSDSTLKLWQVNTGKLVRTFEGHAGWVTSVAFSPNGKLVLSGSDDKTIKLWDVNTGKLMQTFEGHADEVNSVAFSPNEKYIVSGSDDYYGSTDGTVKLWDVRTGTLIRMLKGHTDNVKSVAVSPDGKYIVSGSDDETLKLWQVTTGKLIQTFKGHAASVSSVLFSQDGSQIVSLDDDNSVRFWEVPTGKLIRTFETFFGESADLSPDGKYLVTGLGNSIGYWEVSTGQVFQFLGGNTNPVHYLTFSSDGQLITADHTSFSFWSANLSRRMQAVRVDYSSSIAFSANGRQVLTATQSDTLKLWDANTGQLVRTFKGYSGYVRSVAFSPNGRYALSGSDSILKLWDVNTGKSIRTFKGYKSSYPVAFSPNGKYALSGAWIESNNTHPLKLWDVNSGKLIRTFAGHDKGNINSLAFSPNGKYIVSGSDDYYGSTDGTVKLWDGNTGKLLHTFEGHEHGINSVVFSPNGKYIVSGSGDQTLKLWDVTTGKLIRTFVGHAHIVKSVAFSQNGQFIFSGSYDHTTKIWNTETGKEIATLITVDSSDWVVTTPTGLFDASPGAMALMHYVVNDSTDRDEPWKVIELEQLKQRYYQPGLLPILMGNSKETLRQVPAFEGVNLPPSIQLSLKGDKLTVKLKNRRGGIGPVSVFINGAEVVNDLRANPVRDVNKNDLTLTLSLSRFANRFDTLNTVRVVALNGANWLRSRPVELNYQPAGRTRGGVPEKGESALPRKTVRLWAVVVGTSNLGLNFAHTDAEQIANGLQLAATELLGPTNVSVQRLVTKPGAPPQSTKAEVVKALEAAQKTHPEDIFVLHLSGHAINYGGQDGDLYYLTSGATSADASYLTDPAIRQTYALSSQELTRYLNLIPARKKLLILDVCAAGKGAEKLLVAARDIPASQIRALDRLQERTGFYVLAGSAADAVSYEASVYGQGLLTYALLKGLRGAALRREGSEEFVDVEKWLGYAVEQVPLLAKGIGGIQQPFYRGIQNQRSFDVGRVTEEVKAKIRISEPKPVLLVRSFQEETQFDDVLDLKNKVESALNDLIATRGADAPVLTMEAKDYPGAYTLSGRYTLRGEEISVSCKVFRATVAVGEFVVTGTKSKLPELAQSVLTRAQDLVKP